MEGKFKFLDEHLSLAVGLWAISRAEADLGSKNGAEGLPDMWSELRTPVWENFCKDTVETENMTNQEPGSFRGRREFVQSNKMGWLEKPIKYWKNYGLPGRRQAGDRIESNLECRSCFMHRWSRRPHSLSVPHQKWWHLINEIVLLTPTYLVVWTQWMTAERAGMGT